METTAEFRIRIMADRRATVVIDYQNVHLTGRGLFPSTRSRPAHECLVDPLLFAERLISVRNQLQRPGYPAAVLNRVLVYRGQPSSEHDPKQYDRNQAQKAQWQRDPRVQVTLRPLKYDLERDAAGYPAPGPDGAPLVRGKREKGIDVLCALALVREAREPDTDLVILASDDSDLEPCLDEAMLLKSAAVETFSWYDPGQPTRRHQLRPANGQQIWNTRLNETDFKATWDHTDYA
jgi:hypothetical protein